MPSLPSSLRILAIAMYLISLAMVPYTAREHQLEMRGIGILFLGWGALPTILAWSANPLLIFALIRMKKAPVLSIALCVLGLLLALDFRSVQSLGWDSSNDIDMGTVMAINSGAYIWLASLILAGVAATAYALQDYLSSLPSNS